MKITIFFLILMVCMTLVCSRRHRPKPESEAPAQSVYTFIQKFFVTNKLLWLMIMNITIKYYYFSKDRDLDHIDLLDL